MLCISIPIHIHIRFISMHIHISISTPFLIYTYPYPCITISVSDLYFGAGAWSSFCCYCVYSMLNGCLYQCLHGGSSVGSCENGVHVKRHCQKVAKSQRGATQTNSGLSARHGSYGNLKPKLELVVRVAVFFVFTCKAVRR